MASPRRSAVVPTVRAVVIGLLLGAAGGWVGGLLRAPRVGGAGV